MLKYLVSANSVNLWFSSNAVYVIPGDRVEPTDVTEWVTCVLWCKLLVYQCREHCDQPSWVHRLAFPDYRQVTVCRQTTSCTCPTDSVELCWSSAVCSSPLPVPLSSSPTAARCHPESVNQISTDFDNSFAAPMQTNGKRRRNKNLPPRLTSVATPPCKTWLFNCTTLHYSCKKMSEATDFGWEFSGQSVELFLHHT